MGDFVILCVGVHTRVLHEMPVVIITNLISGRGFLVWLIFVLYKKWPLTTTMRFLWMGRGWYTKKQIYCFYLVILTFPPEKKMTHLQIAFLPPKKKAKKRDLQKRYFFKMTLYYIIIYYYYYYITHNNLPSFVPPIFVWLHLHTAFSSCVAPKH